MAKTVTAPAAPLTAEQIKEQRAQLGQQAKDLREQQKAAKEAEAKAKQEAKEAAEAEAKEKDEARTAAVEVLASAIVNGVADLEPPAVLRCVHVERLTEMLTAAGKTKAAAVLTEAASSLEELGGVKGPKVARSSSNGERHTSNWRKDGGFTGAHMKVLDFLSKQSSPVTLQAIADAVRNGKAKTVRWDLGTISDEGRDPLSLMGRGCVKQVPVDVDGKTDNLYQITADGKKQFARTQKERQAV